MRRFALASVVGIVLLATGYVASGVGNAGTTRALDSTTGSTTSSLPTSTSSSTSTSTSTSVSTTTSTSTTTTTTPTTTTPSQQPKVTICHRTHSKKHPYVRIRVSGNALKAHMRHRGDIIPAPATCPTHVVTVVNHHIVKSKHKGKGRHK